MTPELMVAKMILAMDMERATMHQLRAKSQPPVKGWVNLLAITGRGMPAGVICARVTLAGLVPGARWIAVAMLRSTGSVDLARSMDTVSREITVVLSVNAREDGKALIVRSMLPRAARRGVRVMDMDFSW